MIVPQGWPGLKLTLTKVFIGNWLRTSPQKSVVLENPFWSSVTTVTFTKVPPGPLTTVK